MYVCVCGSKFFYVLLSASLTETTIESVEGIVWGVWEAEPVLPFILLHYRDCVCRRNLIALPFHLPHGGYGSEYKEAIGTDGLLH